MFYCNYKEATHDKQETHEIDKMFLKQLRVMMEEERRKEPQNKNRITTFQRFANQVENKSKSDFTKIDENDEEQVRELKSKRNFLKAVALAVKSKQPVFKICSSKLHRDNYVKRVRDYAEVEFGGVLRRVAFKPAFKKKRIYQVKKIFPLGLVSDKPNPDAFEIRVSIPSGLQISTEPGIKHHSSHIHQEYLTKGPQCQPIENEQSRTMLRNGTMFVKRLDGTITAYMHNGTIIEYEVPFLKETKTIKTDVKVIANTNLARQKLRMMKVFRQTMKRRINHMINGPQSLYRRSRREHLRYEKNRIRPNELYVMEDKYGEVFFPQYTVVSNDGKRIRMDRGRVAESKSLFISKDIDFLNNQQLFEREDGTR